MGSELKRNDTEVSFSLTFNRTEEQTENHQTVENADVMCLVELHTDE